MFNKKVRAWHRIETRMYRVIEIDYQKETVTLYWSNFVDAAIKKANHKSKTLKDVPFAQVYLMTESGLKDDEGFSIFPGDIVEFRGKKLVVGYGWYEKNYFGWYVDNNRYCYTYIGGGKKVGNLFENSELAKGEVNG